MAWPGQVRRCRRGLARHGRARLGPLRRSTARLGIAGMDGRGEPWLVRVWLCRRGLAGLGLARKARRGTARNRRQGKARLGMAGTDIAGMARIGEAWPGRDRHRRQGLARRVQARRGEFRLGLARHCRHGEDRLGGMGCGMAWLCSAGTAGRDPARHRIDWQAWSGRAWPGTEWHHNAGLAR